MSSNQSADDSCIARDQVRNVLRTQLQAAIGNDKAIDLLFDAAGPDSNDKITIKQFSESFLLAEGMAKHLVTAPMQDFRSGHGYAHRRLSVRHALSCIS